MDVGCGLSITYLYSEAADSFTFHVALLCRCDCFLLYQSFPLCLVGLGMLRRPLFCVLVPFNSDNNCFVGADPRQLLLNCMKIKGGIFHD